MVWMKRFGLAIGLRAVRFGEEMLDAELVTGGGEEFGAIGGDRHSLTYLPEAMDEVFLATRKLRRYTNFFRMWFMELR
jgi:hypothetical protein